MASASIEFPPGFYSSPVSITFVRYQALFSIEKAVVKIVLFSRIHVETTATPGLVSIFVMKESEYFILVMGSHMQGADWTLAIFVFLFAHLTSFSLNHCGKLNTLATLLASWQQ